MSSKGESQDGEGGTIARAIVAHHADELIEWRSASIEVKDDTFFSPNRFTVPSVGNSK